MAASQLRPTAYGSVLATYVGATILFTYFRYAQWYDSVNRLGISGVPFFFGYEEGLIRGSLLGLFLGVSIFVIFNKFGHADKCRPVASAVLVLVLYSVATGTCILTQPNAYDPGLVLELMIPGFSAVVSTWLFGGDILLEREPPISDRDFMVEWVYLEHKETIDALTTVALVVVSAIAVAGYNYLQGSMTYNASHPNPSLTWYTFSLEMFDYGFVAIGFAIFIMAPLFLRLNILKTKLKGASTASRKRRRTNVVRRYR